MQAKLKSNKRVIDDNEEEITQLKNRNRKIARDIDELNEQNEILNRELTALRQKQRYVSKWSFFFSLLPFLFKEKNIFQLKIINLVYFFSFPNPNLK